MELVDIRNTQGWEEDEHDDVSQDEISSEEAQFGDLAKEFSSGLRH